MGSLKSPQEIAAECERRAHEVKSEGDKEQLLEISRRLSAEKPDRHAGLVIEMLLPDNKPTSH